MSLSSSFAIAASSYAVPLIGPEESRKGLEIFNTLSKDPSLSFSHDTGRRRFSFVISIGKTTGEDSDYLVHYFVAREENSLTVVMLAANGSPYAYSRTGLCAIVMPERELLLSPTCSPRVQLYMKDLPTRLAFELTFSSYLPHAEVRIDLPSILSAALKGAQSARVSHDGANHVVMLETTKHSLLSLSFSDASGTAESLKKVTMRSPVGFLTVLSNISFDPTFHSAPLEQRAYDVFPIPRKKVPAGSLQLASPLPPSNFGMNSNDRKLIEAFRTLLPGLPDEKALPPSTIKKGENKRQRLPRQSDSNLQRA